MKESEAWQILAEEHDAGRTRSRFLCVNLMFSGVYYLNEAYANEAVASIPERQRVRMARRIQRNLDNAVAYYGDVADDEARQGRVMACLMFAAQTRRER